MPPILMQCQKCSRVYSSGINLGPGATAILKDNISQCPFCGSIEKIPDGTFRGIVEGVIKILEKSVNPLNDAKELLEALERSRTTKDLSGIKKSSRFEKFKKWIPDTPGKLAIYIAIITTIIQLLTREPNIEIEYNKTFIEQYNQTINIEIKK